MLLHAYILDSTICSLRFRKNHGFAALESFSKLGDTIYFEEGGDVPGLYIIQYISNSFNWRSGNLTINLKGEPVFSSDPRFQVSLTISYKEVPHVVQLRLWYHVAI